MGKYFFLHIFKLKWAYQQVKAGVFLPNIFLVGMEINLSFQ
jgi:hypothetical protein